jgi:hypothetical protein
MSGKSILVYIEGEGGGGTSSKRRHLNGEFRKSWKLFLQPLADYARDHGISRFQCIPGRGGASTADKFFNPLPQQASALRILLIDSENSVSDVEKPWKMLEQDPPTWADDKNCYLMVQCLETWLLADVPSLCDHYNKPKKCFNENKLKAWSNLEKVPRKTLQKALEAATADCPNPYTHSDGNFLIAKVEREKLKKLSSVARLFCHFEEKIKEYADV